MTTAERRAALDARLQQANGNFDGLIIVASQGGRGAPKNDSSGAGAGVAGGGTGKDDGNGGQARGLIVAGLDTNSALPTGAGVPRDITLQGTQPAFDPPSDIPKGNDDDVVARQLREAATHEPDAELREKLWNEYRKYTGLIK